MTIILWSISFLCLVIAAITGVGGKRKVFWCCTWQDAIEWVACACNEGRVTVTDTVGFVPRK